MITAMQERRIHILGGAGSGKTLPAQRLSKLTGIRHVDLDEPFWDNAAPGYNTRRDASQRDALLGELVKQDQWIIEGAYHSWLLPSFENADLIIILATPVWLRHWRILRRFTWRLFGKGKARRESLANLWALMKWNHAYDGDNLPRAREYLKPFSHKTREFSSSQKAMRSFLTPVI